MLKKDEHVVSSLTLSLPLIQIFLDGVDTRTVSLESLRNRISVVPQDTSLFDETVEYNLRLGSTSMFTSTEGG
jgi:ABC-type multidrug transport system fused ATPase/permease subunit